MVTLQNKLYKADTLDMGRGAFQALCDSKGVEIVRSGTTFAVSAFFPVLSLSHMIGRFRSLSQNEILHCNLETLFDEYQVYLKRKQGNNKVKLILPSVEASQIVSIDRAIGLGGGSHEVGHIICDQAGRDLSPTIAQKIIPIYKEFAEKKFNLFKVLGRWSNVCADIRLEKMMSKLYPESSVRFQSIQEWIWNDLESQARLSGQMGQNPANCIALMIRDLGKDHKSKSQQRVFNEYATLYPNLWQVALSVKPLWEQLQVSIKEYTTFKKKADMEAEIEKTVHLPLTIAMQILMSLQLPKDDQQTPPQPPQDQNDDDQTTGGEPDDQDSDDDQTTGGDPDDPDQDSDDDQDQNDDDQDQNDDDQDQNGDDQDDQSDSDDDQDQNDDSQDDQSDSDDDQDQNDDDSQDSDDDQDQADKPSDDGLDDDQSDDQSQSNDSDDDQDQSDDDQDQSDDDQNSDDQDQNTPSSQSSFDENTELNLEDEIDPNDIAKAFQKQFDKLVKNLEHKPYISNGLKIIDIQE